jgi:uncharacterized protein YecT (DUF1311 family)
MRRPLTLLLLGLGLALPLGLPAGAARADIEDCGGSNVEMTACIWRHFEAADSELNQVWRRALAEIDGFAGDMPGAALREWRVGLIEAQRAWVAFKDADCRVAVAHEWYGGTGASAAIGACLYAHTRNRIDDLKSRYLDR